MLPRHGARRGRSARARRASTCEIVQRVDGPALPAGSPGAAVGRDRGGVPLLGERRAPCSYRKHQRHPGDRGAPPSTCRRWCSGTWATTAPPASRSRAIRRPAIACFYGEYLKNAQGEDVVAGIRTPQPINKASRSTESGCTSRRSRRRCRAPTSELVRDPAALEQHYRDMQDIEFTIERGKLWMLQTRTGKRTVRAAVKIAVDMAKERLISREDGGAARRPAARSTSCCTRRSTRTRAKELIAKGLPASPGAAVGRVVFTADEAEARAKARREGRAGAHRDLARGHPRHARRRGHPHRARRHDVARRGRGARHGQVLRGRLRRAARSITRARRAARRRARCVRAGDGSRSTARRAK